MTEDLISYERALQILREVGRTHPLRTQRVPLTQALHRILDEDLVSSENHPPWDCSAMDGFAISTIEQAQHPPGTKVAIDGIIAAGDLPRTESEGGVWEIMTGAPLPPGCDVVIRMEDVTPAVRADGGRAVILPPSSPRSRHVRVRGEDFRQGDIFLRAGRRLRSEDLLCLATLGFRDVRVKTPLRVGLIATGKELVPWSQAPGPGQIRNSSALFLELALRERGIEIQHLGRVNDDPAHFRERMLSTEVRDLDLVLSTGAISMGKYDFIGSSLAELDARLFFRKVKVRPAKPILLAEIPRAGTPLLFLGLPGQPVSTAVGLRFFLDPLLESLGLGRSPEGRSLPLAHELKKTPGVVSFLRGRVVKEDESWKVRVHPNQQPSMLSPLLECDAWVQVPAEGDSLAAGDWVKVIPF